MEERIATVNRVTKETDISLTLNLDGSGKCNINTGIGFFDHMLNGFARHGLFDLDLTCRGDLEVDSHHSVEDCGIVLGEAVKQAVGEKKAIKRYGSAMLPMDEALVLCAVDLSGRPYFSYNAQYTVPLLGNMQTEMIHDFFYAVSYTASMNLHIKQISGTNNHHIAESSFKAFGKALDMATMYEERLKGSVWSTKGVL
ncbi:histidine biosynthesis bifunctional protein HisB [Lachnospiraceae bacterium]|jgi:Imidazoleglycerol-phosphate dehydratase|nr:imidazoleglycerol-phosphate dehydratase HisB [Lachnospiraceae bacterium]GFI18248.1 histidine biosynthesis bifunctional protein HisB [Lachnospiraceae bacterium]GFI68730.1 histidine biosynthesis bifunctional protein HisB [Lachnospiraceae bacterium]